MADSFWMNSSDEIIVDGSEQPIDCAICPCTGGDVSTPCNPTAVPHELTLVLTFGCFQISVTLTYSPTAYGGIDPGWAYTGGPDVDICDGYRFRDLVLHCVGSSWAGEWVYTERNSGGTYIQQAGSLTPIVVVSTNPLCLTIDAGPTTPAPASSTNCGTQNLYFAIGSCNVYPPCPVWASLPATATLTYTLGALPSTTMNLTKTASSYDGTAICDLGDGHNRILLSCSVQCDSCQWGMSFVAALETDGNPFASFTSWSAAVRPVGTIVTSDLSVSISPFHAAMSVASSGSVATGGASKTCGGRTYSFANGISGTFDVVTP